VYIEVAERGTDRNGRVLIKGIVQPDSNGKKVVPLEYNLDILDRHVSPEARYSNAVPKAIRYNGSVRLMEGFFCLI
jgi:hypothetical protein